MAKVQAGHINRVFVVADTSKNVLAGAAIPVFVYALSEIPNRKFIQGAFLHGIQVGESYIERHGLVAGAALPIIAFDLTDVKNVYDGPLIPMFPVNLESFVDAGYVLPTYIIDQNNYVELSP